MSYTNGTNEVWDFTILRNLDKNHPKKRNGYKTPEEWQEIKKYVENELKLAIDNIQKVILCEDEAFDALPNGYLINRIKKLKGE